MGKMLKFVVMITLVDILFLTFWGGTTSLQSIIFNWVTDPSNFDGNLVTLVFDGLIQSIAIGALTAVVVALSGAKTDTVLFAAFAGGTLYNIGKDYLFMYQQVNLVSPVLAIIIFLPLVITFSFITIEWLRGKD